MSKWLHIKCPVCKGRVPVGVNERGENVVLIHFPPKEIMICEGSGQPAPSKECCPRDLMGSSIVNVGFDQQNQTKLLG